MGQQSAHLDLTILSASDLKRGWLSAGDQTVAIAWVDPSCKKSTEVTSGGGSNAQWHEKLTLPLSDADVIARHGKWLTIEIRSQGALGGDSLLGTVNVPLADLALDTQKEANTTQTYQLVLPSGKRYGSVSFLGKIVKRGWTVSLPSAPPATLLHAHEAGFHSNASYPPVSQSFVESYTEKPFVHSAYPPPPVSQSFIETYNEKPFVHSAYPPPRVSQSSDETYNEKPFVHSGYPPSVYGWANCTTGKIDGAHQDMNSPHTSYGMAFHRPEVYPPVNAPYPPHNPPPCAPCSNVEGTAAYPLHFPSATYAPPTSMYQDPTPQVLYPPRFPYPPTAPHHLEAPYPPPSWNPYPTHSTPLYPPSYPPQHAPPNCCGPHPAF